MKPIPRPLAALARDRHGLLTAAELRDHQVRGRTRTVMLESGALVPVHRGVYRLGTHAVTFEQRCLAALLAAPTAILSGRTAGRLWDLRKLTTDDVHVLALHNVKLRGVDAHRTDLLARSDWVTIKGLRVLRPGRLLCDLAWTLDDAALESVLEQMIDRRMLSITAARTAARRFIAPGRPGSTRLARVLESRPTWMRPPDSDLELRLWRALEAVGEVFERQQPVELDGGGAIHLDLACPACKFGIEVDHATWHAGRLDSQADKRRDRAAARVGWTVLRVTDEDIERRLDSTVDDIRTIHRDRCVSAAA